MTDMKFDDAGMFSQPSTIKSAHDVPMQMEPVSTFDPQPHQLLATDIVNDATELAEDEAELARLDLNPNEGPIVHGKPLTHHLLKMKKKILARRQRWAAEIFEAADEWVKLSEHMPRAHIASFVASECNMPRQDVDAYLKLVTVLGDQRALLIDKGVPVNVMLDLARQKELVRREALAMISTDRILQSKDLRCLKRDIAAGVAAAEGRPDPEISKAFFRSAAKRAKLAASNWMEDFEKLVQELVDLYGLEGDDTGSSDTLARLDAVYKRATILEKLLPSLVETSLLTEPVGSTAEPPCGWPRVAKDLARVAGGDVMHSSDNWVDQDLVWNLVSAFGYIRDGTPRAFRAKMRANGRIPLDIAAEDGRVSAESRRLDVLEICAGAGAQALGLHGAGFHHVELVEMDPDAASTLAFNRPNWPVTCADVRELDFSDYEGIDLLAGGVPCQPFSSSGARKGKDDERDLFSYTMGLIKKIKPKAVLLENVTGVLHRPITLYRLEIQARLAAMGYESEWRIINAVDFKLSQKRRRAILVAFRPGIMHRFRWPTALTRPGVTVGELLLDLMSENNWPGAKGWAERADGYAPTLIGGSQKKQGIDLAREKSRESWRMLGIDPSHYAHSAPEATDHPYMVPMLTLRMMARLQGFPDYWRFSGPDLQQFHQIANAFPPLMARAVGFSIMRALTGSEVDFEVAMRGLKPDLAALMYKTRFLNPDENDLVDWDRSPAE